MAELLSSTDYDKKLLELENFQLRPFSLPFIGSKMGERAGVLFIMESHYTNPVEFFQHQYDKVNLIEEKPELFYNIKNGGFTEAFKSYLDTRKIIADSQGSDPKLQKGKSVYRKLAAVVKEGLKLEEDKTQSPLDYVAVYNYFQRPSYRPGKTIKLYSKDEEVAYETLQHIVKTITVTKIIFTSAKAYDSFIKKDAANNNLIGTDRKFYRGTHPRVWGNKCTYEEGITWKEWVIGRLRS